MVLLAETDGIILLPGHSWETDPIMSDQTLIQNTGKHPIKVKHPRYKHFEITACTERLEAEIDTLKKENAKLRNALEKLTEAL